MPRQTAAILLFAALAGSACSRRSEPPARAVAPAGFGGWEEVRIGTDAWFHGLHFVDANTGWIVGSSPFVPGGIAGRTEDGGKTWRYVSGVTKGGPTRGLAAVRGLDRMRACAVGAGIFVTFDGGASWQRAQAPHAADALSAVDFLDDREGFTAGAGGVFRTTDAGLTWTKVDADAEARIGSVSPRALHFQDSRNGFLSGANGNLWRTRDSGETWARVSLPIPSKAPEPSPSLLGMAWQDVRRGWLVGESGTVLRTEDGGDTWSAVDVGAKNAILSAVSFAGTDGWIVGYLPDNAARSVVYRTSDSGATWALERTLDGEELRAVQALDADTAWAIGDRTRTEPQRMLRRTRRP